MNGCWILNPVNPVEVIDPIAVDVRKLLHVYPVAGVLFSARAESVV
jgi:hypothetical protein